MAGLEDVIETLKEFNQLREHSIRLREGGTKYLTQSGKGRRDHKMAPGASSPALDLVGHATFFLAYRARNSVALDDVSKDMLKRLDRETPEICHAGINGTLTKSNARYARAG